MTPQVPAAVATVKLREKEAKSKMLSKADRKGKLWETRLRMNNKLRAKSMRYLEWIAQCSDDEHE